MTATWWKTNQAQVFVWGMIVLAVVVLVFHQYVFDQVHHMFYEDKPAVNHGTDQFVYCLSHASDPICP